jgi:hypothetical protein
VHDSCARLHPPRSEVFHVAVLALVMSVASLLEVDTWIVIFG